MRQTLTALLAAVGFGLAAGGVCALHHGVHHPGITIAHGLGPLNGRWEAENFCFLGAVLAGFGTGFGVFGLLVRKKVEPTHAPYLP